MGGAPPLAFGGGGSGGKRLGAETGARGQVSSPAGGGNLRHRLLRGCADRLCMCIEFSTHVTLHVVVRPPVEFSPQGSHAMARRG